MKATRVMLIVVLVMAVVMTLRLTGVWSPGGDSSSLTGKIAFSSTRDGIYKVYVMNADGSNQRRLTYNDAVDWEPCWSPDGNKIAFVSDRDGNYEIYVMNADGSSQTRLAYDDMEDGDPCWSPDSRQIVFCSDRDGEPEIHIMDADGSNQRRLTYGGGFSPSWSWQ